jgi:hypothetical protein
MSISQCNYLDCNNNVVARGYCKPHYHKLRKTGELKINKRSRYNTGTCEFENCNKKHHANGYCSSHANQFARTGKVWDIKPRKIGCIIQDCTKKHSALGYCELHYERLKRNGDPLKLTKNWTVEKREEHGLRNTAEYRVWDSMKSRCYNPKNTYYEYYGGRGITICDRWLKSFSAFYEDMGQKPSPKHSIDRINPNGNYEPENCRWATNTEQILNRRMNKNNTTGVVGVYKSHKKWSAEIWVNYKKIILGSFENFEDAVKARKDGETKYRGKQYGTTT